MDETNGFMMNYIQLNSKFKFPWSHHNVLKYHRGIIYYSLMILLSALKSNVRNFPSS